MRRPPKPFDLFVWSRGVSWAGNALTAVALPVLVFQRTGSATLAGVLAVCESTPYLLLGLHAGAIVDRLEARRVMTATTWASAVVAASVPVAAAFGVLTSWQLLGAALATSALFVFFDAASFGAVPAIVGVDGVGRATSRLLTVSTVIGILVPPLAGILTSTIGPPLVLLLDAVSYGLSAILLARVRWQQPTRSTGTSLRADILGGLRFIRETPLIRDLTLLGIGNSLTAGAVAGLLVVAAVRTLGLSSHGWQIGLLYAAAAIGTLAAARLVGPLQQRARVGVITLAALALNLAFLLGWALASSLLAGALALLCWQFTNSFISLNGIIVRQTITPPELQGRVNTTARMIAWGGTPIGAAIAGVLADALDARRAIILAGAGVAASLLVGLSTSLRRHGRLSELRADPTA